MAIQCAITLPNGVTVNYHKINTGSFDLTQSSLNISVNRYVAKDNAILDTVVYNISPILSMLSPAPPSGYTVSQVVANIVEQYLIAAVSEYSGGVQVD